MEEAKMEEAVAKGEGQMGKETEEGEGEQLGLSSHETEGSEDEMARKSLQDDLKSAWDEDADEEMVSAGAGSGMLIMAAAEVAIGESGAVLDRLYFNRNARAAPIRHMGTFADRAFGKHIALSVSLDEMSRGVGGGMVVEGIVKRLAKWIKEHEDRDLVVTLAEEEAIPSAALVFVSGSAITGVALVIKKSVADEHVVRMCLPADLLSAATVGCAALAAKRGGDSINALVRLGHLTVMHGAGYRPEETCGALTAEETKRLETQIAPVTAPQLSQQDLNTTLRKLQDLLNKVAREEQAQPELEAEAEAKAEPATDSSGPAQSVVYKLRFCL